MDDAVSKAQALQQAMIFLIPAVAVVAFFAFLAVAGWARERRREREAFYRQETARKLIEKGAMSSEQFASFLDEEAARPQRVRRESLKLAGLVLALAGLGALVGGFAIDEVPLQGLAWIPTGIGVALLGYAFLLAPKLPPRGP